MKNERLDNVCDVFGGYAFKKEGFAKKGIPLITHLNIDDKQVRLDGSNTVYLTPSYLKKYEQYSVSAGDILIALSGATIGKYGIYRGEGPALVNHRVAVVRVTKTTEVNPSFIAYYFNTLANQLSFKTKGPTKPVISIAAISDLKISLPPLETQHHIVAILDKTQGIIEKRKASIQLLDQLLNDYFLYLLNDPQFNSSAWKTETLSNYIDLISVGSKASSKFFSGKPDSIFLQLQNVGKNELLMYDYVLVKTSKTQEANKARVQPGDVLVAMTGDRGRCCVVPELAYPTYIHHELCLIRLNGELNPHYVSAFFASPLGQMQLLPLKQGIKGDLKPDNIRNCKILIPPQEIQQHYQDFKNEITSIKSGFRESITYTKFLFQSLVQNAFTGDLEIESAASELEEARQSVQWLQQQTAVLPQTKSVTNLNKKLAMALVDVATEGIPALIKGAISLWNFFKVIKPEGFAAIKTSDEAETIVQHEAFNTTQETKQVAKLLVEHAGQQEKIKHKESADATINDPVTQYLDETKLGEVMLGGSPINLVKFVRRHYGSFEFSINEEDLGTWLAEEENITTVSEEDLKNAVFDILDSLIIQELWCQPFTFQSLQTSLKQLHFNPGFELLNEYVLKRLEDNYPLLLQAYYDEQMPQINEEAYQYLQNLVNPEIMGPDAFTPQRRMYLIHNTPKIKLHNATAAT